MELLDSTFRGLRFEYDTQKKDYFVGYVGEEDDERCRFPTYEKAKSVFIGSCWLMKMGIKYPMSDKLRKK